MLGRWPSSAPSHVCDIWSIKVKINIQIRTHTVKILQMHNWKLTISVLWEDLDLSY